jgi:hypothetical protein
MKDFIFDKLAKHSFIVELKIQRRRYALETLCAQIAINSFTRAKVQSFARTRYEDLLFFFREYENPEGKDLEFFKIQSKKIVGVLDELRRCFGERATELSNRSYILSIYLLREELGDAIASTKDRQQFVDFIFALWKRLRQEVSSGIDTRNRELYAFETMLSSAPGERSRIEQRHEKLLEYFMHFKKTRKIKGD